MKVLFVFTKVYPYKTAEQYLVDESQYLAKAFDKVVFIPSELFGEIPSSHRPLPANCEVLLLNAEAEKIKSGRKGGEFLNVLLGEWMRCRSKSWFWKERKRYASVLLHQQHLASVFKEILERQYKNDDPAFYAYWIHNSSIMLGLMKRRGDIKDFICRGHSIDLYESDWALVRYVKILPFYNFIIRQSTKISAISKHGSDYLKKRFPEFKDKFSFSRLGVDDLGINPFNADTKFTIVSCSNFSDNKRVERIAESIGKMKIPTRWIHFGDGPGREKTEAIIKTFPSHITAELKGFTPNEQIKIFYATETANLVINLSEAEGIPVSLMEAISFGIPVLATAVYGNPEVANENTGFSVNFNASTDEIAAVLNRFASDNEEQQVKRISARKFYLDYFSAASNYSAFTSELHKLL